MQKLANHTALKEWAEVIDALASGDQVILIRKGGIADPHFGLEADRFYLYPTYFHQQDGDAPRESVAVTAWCEVIRTWRVSDPEAVLDLAGHTVLPPATVEARYRFRPDQALHVIGVRAWRLEFPARVIVRDAYRGCTSWISVDEEIDVSRSHAALREDELRARLEAIDAVIAARGARA